MGFFDDVLKPEAGAPAAPAGGFFDDVLRAPALASFSERFAQPQAPANAKALASGLEDRATDMTTGPRVPSAIGMTIDSANQMRAAQQGTTPIISAQRKNLVSTEALEGDDGNLYFRDPVSRQVVQADAGRHVLLQDPTDARFKVYERSPGTNAGPLEGVSRVMSQGLMAGAPTARPSIPAPTAAQIIPRASDTFATAKPYYRGFDQVAGGIEVPAETATGIADRIRGALGKANLIEDLAKPVYSGVAILDRGQPMTLDELQNVKRVVGRSFDSADKNVRDAAGVATREIGKVIAEVSPEAGDALKTADAIHSTALAQQKLQRMGGVADLRTGRAGYGGNAVNAMRQILSPVAEAAIKGRVTGFQPDEIAAIRDIVEGTPATNTARLVGQLSPSKGIIQTGTAMGAAYAGGPAALAIPALGMGANKLATVLTGRQIDALRELVAKRSPEYAQAVSRATERWERAQMDLLNDPSPARLAAYTAASRTLSSGLTRDGISVTSGDLMRAVASHPQPAAEENQQP